MVNSLKGTPQWRSAWRALSQAAQFFVEYNVTGYLDIAWRVSYGTPLAAGASAAPFVGALIWAAAGGLSVYVILPSGPTTLYVCASAPAATLPSSSATEARRARRDGRAAAEEVVFSLFIVGIVRKVWKEPQGAALPRFNAPGVRRDDGGPAPR